MSSIPPATHQRHPSPAAGVAVLPVFGGQSTSMLLQMFTAFQKVRGFSPRTVQRRQWSLRAWCEFLGLHGVALERAQAIHVESFLARWESAQSRQSVRSDIRQFYRWALQRDLIDGADPTDNVPPPRVPERAASPVAPGDVGRLLANTTGEVRLMIMLYACAGLRASEIARLRGEDVDIDAGRLVVRQGKGGKDGVLPLADELGAELARFPRVGKVFPHANGRGYVSSRIKTAFIANGIQARPHDLRHSYATQAAARTNGNLIAVQRLMRHAQATTTQRYVEWHVSGAEVVTGLYGDVAAS